MTDLSDRDALYEKYALAKYANKEYLIVEITGQDVALGAEGFRKQLKRIQTMKDSRRDAHDIPSRTFR